MHLRLKSVDRIGICVLCQNIADCITGSGKTFGMLIGMVSVLLDVAGHQVTLLLRR